MSMYEIEESFVTGTSKLFVIAFLKRYYVIHGQYTIHINIIFKKKSYFFSIIYQKHQRFLSIFYIEPASKYIDTIHLSLYCYLKFLANVIFVNAIYIYLYTIFYFFLFSILFLDFY